MSWRFSKQEKWFVFGLLGVLMLILRLPSLWQTWWYGDENIYMAIGQAIVKGQWLYVEAWDHKPPMIYLVYALSYWLFGDSLWPLRLLNAGLAWGSVVAFYWLSSRLFGLSSGTSQVLAVVYTIALNLVFEGIIFNGENWFMPLIWLGLVCLVIGLNLLRQFPQAQFGWWLLGAVLWSLAAFSKLHAVLEIGVLTVVLIVLYSQSQAVKVELASHTSSPVELLRWVKSWLIGLVTQMNFWRYFGSLAGLIGLPYLISALVYWLNGYWSEFYVAVWGYNQDYVTYGSSPVILFGYNLSDWGISSNQLRLLLLGLWLLVSSWLLLSQKLAKRWFWLTNWWGATMCAVLLSERNYPHYMLQILPLGCLSVGLLGQRWMTTIPVVTKLKDTIFSLLIVQIFMHTFTQGSLIINFYSPITYFVGFTKVVLSQRPLAEWQAKFNLEVVNNRELLIDTIQQYTTPTDKIFLIADRADLYFLSGRLSGHRFLVHFHYSTEDLPEIIWHLRRNHTKLIMVDQNTPKAEAAFNLLASQEFQLVDTVLDRYHFWLKPEAQTNSTQSSGDRCLGVTNARC